MDEHTHQWNVTTLYEHFKTRFEGDRQLYEERFQQQLREHARQEENVKAKVIADAQALFLLRSEAKTELGALANRLERVESRMDVREGEALGRKAVVSGIVSGVGVVALVVGALIGHFAFH